MPPTSDVQSSNIYPDIVTFLVLQSKPTTMVVKFEHPANMLVMLATLPVSQPERLSVVRPVHSKNI